MVQLCAMAGSTDSLAALNQELPKQIIIPRWFQQMPSKLLQYATSTSLCTNNNNLCSSCELFSYLHVLRKFYLYETLDRSLLYHPTHGLVNDLCSLCEALVVTINCEFTHIQGQVCATFMN